MRALMLTAMLTAILAQGACGPKPEPAPAKPKPVVSDFSQDMDAKGTEPFWSMKIRGTQFTITRPDHPEITATAPGATIVSGQATWNAQTADGRPLTVKLYVSTCQNGMAYTVYPLAAEVVLPGESSLSGCAYKTAQAPRAPTR